MPALQPQPDPHQEALAWFALLHQSACDETTRQAFAHWCADASNAQAYAALQTRLLRVQPTLVRPRPRPIQAALKRSRAGLWLGALFVLILAALAYLYWPWAERLASQLHSDAGERRTVRLSEGSLLHLDSASAVNMDLRGKVRHLQLVQGQVLLEVKLDGRELDVQVGEARVQVFGTRVMIARQAERDELVVLAGKAVVLQGDQQRLVSAGERLSFGAQGLGDVAKAPSKNVDAWRHGQLIADDQPLADVLQRLAGYQGQRLWLLDGSLAHRRVSGDFNLDRADETLTRLAASEHLQIDDVLGLWLLVRNRQ